MTRLRSKASPAAQDFAGKMNRRRALRTVGAGMLIAPVGWSLPVEASTINPYFDVKDYGATGNGTTDDITAIQNAVNAAASAGGGIVFFPTGRYRVSATITIANTENIILQGAGPSSIVLMTIDNGTIVKIGSVTGDSSQTIDHKIRDLSFDRSVAASNFAVAIHIEIARYVTVESVAIHNQGIGILVGKGGVPNDAIPGQDITISNCHIGTFSTYGFNNIPDSCIKLLSCAGVTLHNVNCEPGFIGIDLQGNSNGVLINECTIVNGGPYSYGVIFRGTGFSRYMTGCILENATGNLVLIDSGQRVFIDNCWLGAGDTNNANRLGILIQAAASEVVIGNSRIGDQGIGGVYISGNNVTLANNIITNNTINIQSVRDSITVSNADHVNLNNNRVANSSGVAIRISGSSNHVLCTNNDCSGQGITNTATGTSINITGNFT